MAESWNWRSMKWKALKMIIILVYNHNCNILCAWLYIVIIVVTWCYFLLFLFWPLFFWWLLWSLCVFFSPDRFGWRMLKHRYVGIVGWDWYWSTRGNCISPRWLISFANVKNGELGHLVLFLLRKIVIGRISIQWTLNASEIFFFWLVFLHFF